MFKHYRKTHLEDFVEQIYIQHDIIVPTDITVKNLGKSLNVIVEYVSVKGISCRSENGKIIILIDKHRSIQQQRLDFLHELGHILRHEGNQTLLPRPFVKYQEDDTEHFVLYALMPFFMIERLELSPDRKQAVKQLAAAFTVGTDLASKRYDQIMRREFEGASMSEAAETALLGKEVKPIDSFEPQFMVYYDPSGTLDGPSQMVVILDEWTLMNCREIVLPVYDRLPEVDSDEMREFDGIPVRESDVVCFDGIVTLQVHELLFRYGLVRRKFLIHMNVVDMLMARDQLIIRKLDW